MNPEQGHRAHDDDQEKENEDRRQPTPASPTLSPSRKARLVEHLRKAGVTQTDETMYALTELQNRAQPAANAAENARIREIVSDSEQQSEIKKRILSRKGSLSDEAKALLAPERKGNTPPVRHGSIHRRQGEPRHDEPDPAVTAHVEFQLRKLAGEIDLTLPEGSFNDDKELVASWNATVNEFVTACETGEIVWAHERGLTLLNNLGVKDAWLVPNETFRLKLRGYVVIVNRLAIQLAIVKRPVSRLEL